MNHDGRDVEELRRLSEAASHEIKLTQDGCVEVSEGAHRTNAGYLGKPMAKFVYALVNAYRSGKLVPLSSREGGLSTGAPSGTGSREPGPTVPASGFDPSREVERHDPLELPGTIQKALTDYRRAQYEYGRRSAVSTGDDDLDAAPQWRALRVAIAEALDDAARRHFDAALGIEARQGHGEDVVEDESPAASAATPQAFIEWFAKNYPGPDTVIFNPHWHAPKIYRAALHAATPETSPPNTGASR